MSCRVMFIRLLNLLEMYTIYIYVCLVCLVIKLYKLLISSSQMKHQLDATLCRFYFCRVTLQK